MAKPAPLPKRFQPLLNQANTEAALRYGSQESGLASLLGQLTHNYQQQSQAQNTMGQSLLGSLKGADQRLQGVYSDAGLTPSLLAGIANSPTGQRLAGELAQGRGDIQSQMLGAQAGQQYIQAHLGDQYHQDVGQLSDQLTAEQKERGLFTQSQLDTLISGDRAARHDANLAAAKQSHDDLQAELQRQSATGNALIGQGLAPVLGADGSVSVGAPLPGGKADPNAPGNKSSKKLQTPAQQAAFASQVSNIASFAEKWKGHSRSFIVKKLQQGRPQSSGWADPKTGNPVPAGTPGAVPYTLTSIPQFKADLAMSAALDVALAGHLSKTTQDRIHAQGLKLADLGLKTLGQYQRQRQQSQSIGGGGGTAQTPDQADRERVPN